ncbi:MAG: class I SAM-dependent methyltransferase [Pseudomonadota bacterium]|nr:class I SAM-dependent methyltransferase [Pseudomonadota bacterium]
MNTIPTIHLCVVQPAGYLHSLGFLDQARYFRHQFRRMGAQVSLAKNRLRHDAVNFVFGAHLGFDPTQRDRYSCIFVNLEQLGRGGAALPGAYVQLLGSSAVVEYDADNIAAYTVHADEVPVFPLLHAPYLRPAQTLPLEERPIDLLFIGSMNERRAALIRRIESTGHTVSLLDTPLYGPERDQIILQSKAVLNMHFYESSRFEQARVSHCLSLHTPVVSERDATTRPHPAFEDSVAWFDDAGLETFFAQRFGTPEFFDAARAGWAAFERADPIEAYADVLAFAAGFGPAHQARRPTGPWRPGRINLGSGKDYKAGWLNLDILDRAEPDAVLDLGQPIELPMALASRFGGQIELVAGTVDRIYANNVLEHVPDLPCLMGNALALLKEGGEFEIEVPYEKALTAWQDPTHLRALNENSWIYYTEWFWYLGWFEHRFEVAQSTWLDMQLRPCGKDAAAFMRVTLRKLRTTMQERMVARTMAADSMIPDDVCVE